MLCITLNGAMGFGSANNLVHEAMICASTLLEIIWGKGKRGYLKGSNTSSTENEQAAS